MSAHSGNTEVTASVNSLLGYEVPQEVLQNALRKELENPNESESEGYLEEEEEESTVNPTPQGSQIVTPGAPPETRANATVENFLSNPSYHYDLYVESRERMVTPQHLVEVDEVVYGSKGLDWDDQHATIEDQAEDYIYKLDINRNHLVPIHTTVNTRRDLTDLDDINYSELLRKPTHFHVLGKPGVGATTFARKFADKMNLVYISPVSAIEYFTGKKNELPTQPDINIPRETPPTASLALLASIGIDDSQVFEFLKKRMEELDVKHRGYILDGWPILRSEEIPVADQLEMLRQLPQPPDILFIMQMQNRDLFKRRVDQKMDPLTSIIYTKKQYIRPMQIPRELPATSHQDISNIQSRSKVSLATGMTMSVTTISSTGLHDRDKTEDQRMRMEEEDEDFLPLQPAVVGRLISRLEDHPVQVHKDFENWKIAITPLQQYINSLDRTKLFELDVYHSPKIVVENAVRIMSAIGILPSPVPVEISHPINKMAKRVRPEDELEGYSSGEEEEDGTDTPGCVPDDEGIKDNIDWAPILRAIVLIARIDPRFRWRISRWKNLCPVALKEGRSVAGNPQRAYGLFDKVYFLSTEDAVQKFSFNPRRYLIKDMPTSPVKFFVVGHPLAGKTLFAHELASLSGGYVIDMRRQTRKCLEAVKQRFLFKTRFEATMQAKKDINKRNYEAWKRQERFRRQRIHKWIDDYNKRRAAEEINAALAIEREDRMKEYRKLRWKSEFHELSAPFKASPCVAEPLAFSWKKFVEDIKRGVEAWTHQERLELAWELFKEGRLRYKMKGGKGPNFRRVYRGSSAAEGYGLEEESGGGSDGEQVGEGGSDEGVGEGEEVGEEEDRRRKRRKRRKKRKKIKCKKPAEEITVVTEDEEDSSPFSSDGEPDESLRLQYPDMCPELTEPIPRPGEVEDQNEQVQAYVREKVAETEKWVNTIPGEVYEEILGIGIQEAERKYREAHPDAHETGGWIVENLAEDVEKWRGILRNTKLCPDQVFVLQDTSTDYSRISNRLKRLFLNSVAEGKVKLQSIAHVGRRSRKRQTMEYWAGGEESYPPPEFEDHFGRDYLGAEDQSVTTDNLVGHLCATPSELMHIMMDQRRQRSRVASNDSKDSVTNYDELGKVVDVVDKKDIDVSISLATSKTFKVTPPTPATTTTAESEAAAGCKPLWRTAVSLREMGKIPGHKPEIYEMKVILPLSEAERRVGSGGWYEYEGESASLLDAQKNMMTIMEETEEMMGEQEEMSLDGLRSTEYAGEGEGQDEDIGDRKSETSHIPTPSGLNTPVDELSRLDCDPEDETCQPPVQPLSLKKSFLKQVSGFDDFWNMVFPVVSAQKVGVFMVGIVDEMTAKNIAQKFWDDLQDRFGLPPIPVTLADLEEDDADVRESRALWTGKKDEPKMMPEGSDFDEDEEEDERSDGEKSEGEMTGLYSSRLKGLEGNPDSYRAVLQSIEENQLFGDFKHYCPVTLADHKLLRKGSARYAVRYQDRLYYLANHDAYVRFMAEPKQFLPPPDKKCIPAPRICITGSPGCDQRGIALELSERAGIYFVDFRERLQDIIKGRLGKDVGPFHTGEIVTRAESPSESENEEDDRKGEEDGGEGEEDEIFDADTEWIKEKRERKQMEKLALQSLAIADKADVETFPINSLERTEEKANKVAPVGQLNQKERCIKNFLETGAQLPPEVLDDFIPQLWTEEPFKSTGFLLAGFPNTAKDVQYLIDRDCIPEYVYIMECKKKTCRNRLIREAMARWHRRDQLEANANMAERIRAKMRDRRGRGDMLDENKEVKVSIWCNNEKACVKAAKALYHYYYIFSRKMSQMKGELNQRRVDWVSVPTDRSLFEAKAKLRKLLTPALKYRRNVLEATHVLYPEEAESLVKRHYFHLSKFSRWCPVEVFKGNQGINLWNASGITKYPVLYRNYIYFIAGEDNLEDFRSQVLDIVEHAPPLPTVPVSVVIIGPPKSGKTDLCRRISKKLGLLYINEAEVIGNILRHAIAIELDMDDAPVFQGPQPMIFAQKVHIYLKKGHSVPRFMFYRALDYALMHPLAQHHGVVFDGYPMDDLSVQEMVDRGIVPASVIQLDVDIQTVLQRCEKERRVPNYNYEFLLQDCDDLMRAQYEYFGPMSSPCLLWYGHKMQNLVYLDGTKNPAVVFEEARSEIMKSQAQRQQVILKLINSKGKISRQQSKFRPKSVPKVPTNSAFSAATPPPQQLVF